MKIVAVAVVSRDGCIADADGNYDALKSSADSDHLRHQIEISDALLHGRTSYEMHQKVLAKRNNVVVTSQVESLERESDNLLWWNPLGAGFDEMLTAAGVNKRLCVLGGGEIYTLARRQGWLTDLLLTAVHNVELGEQGTPLFTDIHGIQVWQQLESGDLGFRMNGAPVILPGAELSENAPLLFQYKRTDLV